MRLVSFPAAANDLLADLGLASEIAGKAAGVPGEVRDAPDVARATDLPAPDQPLLSGLGAHEHTTRFVVDRPLLRAVRPDVLITEEVCPVCRAAYRPLADGAAVSHTTIDGQDVTLVTLNARRLEDVLAPIVPLATMVGHPQRGHSLLNTRSARLLALGMHVARHLVRNGGDRPRVVLAAVGGELSGPRGVPPGAGSPLRLPGRWLPDMIDAAGGVPLLAEAGGDDLTLAPERVSQAQPDVLLLGAPDLASARGAATALAADGAWGDVPAVRQGRTWALHLDGLFTHPSPRLVEGVEILLRIIFPQALGANGAPPAADRALPVHAPLERPGGA